MSQNPGAHSSHGNSYSHGASSSKSAAAGTKSRKPTGSGASSGQVSSTGSSATSSALNSSRVERECERDRIEQRLERPERIVALANDGAPVVAGAGYDLKPYAPSSRSAGNAARRASQERRETEAYTSGAVHATAASYAGDAASSFERHGDKAASGSSVAGRTSSFDGGVDGGRRVVSDLPLSAVHASDIAAGRAFPAAERATRDRGSSHGSERSRESDQSARGIGGNRDRRSERDERRGDRDVDQVPSRDVGSRSSALASSSEQHQRYADSGYTSTGAGRIASSTTSGGGERQRSVKAADREVGGMGGGSSTTGALSFDSYPSGGSTATGAGAGSGSRIGSSSNKPVGSRPADRNNNSALAQAAAAAAGGLSSSSAYANSADLDAVPTSSNRVASAGAVEQGEQRAPRTSSSGSKKKSSSSSSRKKAGSKKKSSSSSGGGGGGDGDGSSSASTKPPKALSRKKQALLNEQINLTGTAAEAAALLAEKQALEARIAAREAREREEQEHEIAVQEAGRLYTEKGPEESFDSQRAAVLARLEDAVYEAQQWERYLACNPLPDVRVPSELNAFVSSFRERDPVANPPHLSLVPTLDACDQAEAVVQELQARAAEAREENHLFVAEQCDRYVHLLRALERKKIDELTCKFLTRADEYENNPIVSTTPASSSVSATSASTDAASSSSAAAPAAAAASLKSFTVGHSVPSLSFGLWVHNSSRTDRIKRIELMDKIGVNIELPQSLQKARTAIRIVRTRYDNVAVIQQQQQKQQQQEQKEAATAANASSSSSAASATTVKASNSRPGTRGDAGLNRLLSNLSVSALSGSGVGSGADGDTDGSSSAADVDEAFRDPTSVFDFSLHPPPSSPASSHFVSLGGVIELQQLLLPPQATKLKNFIMREITILDQHVVTVPYPSEEAMAALKAAQKSGTNATAALGAHSAALAPLRLKFTIPDDIFLSEDRQPLFGFWDASASKGAGEWKSEGVEILEFDPETRIVALSLPTIKPLAVIQPRALDFPYRSWSLMPIRASADGEDDDTSAASTCRLEVTGSRFSVCVEMHGLVARLVSPSHRWLHDAGRFGVDGPTGGWFAPGMLLQRLAEVGINVAPSDADAIYCRKPLKSALLIRALHEHLSLLTSVFDSTFSPHNVSRSGTAATFRMRLNKHSLVLSAAAARRSLLDWEAEEEEAERLDLPISEESIRNFPKQEAEEERDENGNVKLRAKDAPDADAIDAQIREMEAEETAAAAAAARVAEEARAKKAAADAAEDAIIAAAAAARKKQKTVDFDDVPVVAPIQPLTAEQRYAQAFEWVTVLAEQIEAPSDPALAEAAAAAAGSTPAFAASASAEQRRAGHRQEGLPSGILLRFTLIRGDATASGSKAPDAMGAFDATPLPGCTSHFSLRRCLLEYFADKTPHDLCTAMSMARPRRSGGEAAGAAGTDAGVFHFIPFEPIVLQTQQTVRKTLNLLRPLIFC